MTFAYRIGPHFIVLQPSPGGELGIFGHRCRGENHVKEAKEAPLLQSHLWVSQEIWYDVNITYFYGKIHHFNREINYFYGHFQ